MTRIAVLDRARHGALRLKPTRELSRQRYALLGLSELATACSDFPICLAKDAQTGRFNLIALFSLEEPRNLFWLGDQWQATYLLQATTTAPFLLDAGAELGLAIDEDHPQLGREGVPLFEADGRPTQLLTDVRAHLQRVMGDVEAAQAMVDRFVELRLVRPLTLVLRRSNNTEHEIAGLYSLGARALAALSDDMVVNLYRRGYIAAASLMRASLNQMERLRQLHNASSNAQFAGVRVQVAESD